MNLPRKLKRLFEALSIIGLILAIALIFSIQRWVNPPASGFITFTPASYATFTTPSAVASIPSVLMSPLPPYDYPTVMPPTTATPVAAMGQEPPPCTFPLPQTTTEESSPENYTFSEPRVVLADPNAAFNIFEWTPDSQQVLIIREVIKNHYEQYQSIELFNPRTIKDYIYAKRSPGEFIYDSPPLWVAGLNAVIYPERLVLSPSYDSKGALIPGAVDTRQMLQLSRGDPADIQTLEDATLSGTYNSRMSKTFSSVAVKPDGSEIIYLRGDGKQLYQREVSQDSFTTVQSLLFDLTQWDPAAGSYKMAWRPGTSQIFFYSQYSQRGSYSALTFLLDADTGHVCGLNVGGWVYLARWSPNGRYLAVIKSIGPQFPLWEVYDMSVLDTATGILYPIEAAQLKPLVGTSLNTDIIQDLAWGPDNRHLAVIGSVVSFGTSPPPDRTFLYLVDFLSGKIDNLFPSTQFYTSFPGTSLAWSPDGSKILAICWNGKELKLCLVPVERTGQP
jgi:WD40 repeat protein